MTQEEAQRLFHYLLASDAEADDCASVNNRIECYVDLQVQGLPADVLMPIVACHIAECPPCTQAWDTLRTLAQLEAEDRLPTLDELFDSLRTTVSGAGVAIVGATQPDRPVPVPTPEALDAMTSGSAPQRSRRRLPQGTWLRLAAAVGVVAVGVWGFAAYSERDGQAMRSALSGATEIVEMHGPSGGPRVKVFFNPDSQALVVQAGDLPSLVDGARIECWLKRQNGSRWLAAAFQRVDPRSEWWVIDAQEPVGDLQALALMMNRGGEMTPLVEVPLATPLRR